MNPKIKQLGFWKEKSVLPDDSSGKVSILFRESIPEIPSTTYGTFSIYKYPAKFIPQIIAFVLKNYAMPGMKIFDPFAGYGTVGITARVYGYDYELWDLNPIIDVIHKTSIMKPSKVDLDDLMSGIKNSNEEFIPKWLNLHYWYPEEFLPMLFRAWGFVHSLSDNIKYFVLVPLIKVTKYFSYDDEKVHKLYKSRYSKEKIENLLKIDWKSQFYIMLEREISLLFRKILEYNSLNPRDVNYKIRSGIDTLETDLESEVNILITSPPYLQAQEYIRSTKMELFWLGYEENYIRELSKKEIPYRKVEKIKIYSDRYYEYREKIKEEHLKTLYDQYFYAILSVLTKLGEKTTNYMCIFVGPAKIRTLSIPIDEIIIEHLQEFGWRHEITFVDTIVSRVMFKSKINPASGLKDERIPTEHLVILRKKQ
ncbi:MAG: hypothetical protein ACP5PT_04610 [Brevinematia bacterium]|uniref:hypothetical protein n=1 Tax=Dictyoglomus turgidum TaxID=513050 RepID=UPI003C78AF3E